MPCAGLTKQHAIQFIRLAGRFSSERRTHGSSKARTILIADSGWVNWRQTCATCIITCALAPAGVLFIGVMRNFDPHIPSLHPFGLPARLRLNLQQVLA
jgi:hypothetical protein